MGGRKMRKYLVILMVVFGMLLWTNSALAASYGQIICEAANMREEPDVTSEKVLRVKNGVTFEIMGEIADARQDRQENGEVVMWYKVRYDDKEGFLKQDLVVNAEDYLITRQTTNLFATPWSIDKRTGEITKNQKLLVIEENEEWYAVSYGIRSGFIRKDDALVWTSDEIEYFYSQKRTKAETKRSTEIRTGAGENWAKITTIEKAEELELVASEADWYIMLYQEAIGYIKKADVVI